MRLRRLFWIGAAGLLGLAALISIVAVVRGDFTETDGKILLSLGAAFLAGSAALAGLALVDRGDLVPLGRLVTAAGLVAFAILAWQVWVESNHEELWLDTLIAVVALLTIATSRLLHRGLEWLWWVSTALTAALAGALVWLVHADPDLGDSWAQALGTLAILTALAWFLVPVLGRLSARPGERVVGRGPGTFEVELAAGETLVVRAG